MSTFYFDEAHTGFISNINTFMDAIKALIPSGVTISTLNSGDLIDVATGELSGTWTDGTTSTVVTTGLGLYASGVGCRIRWATAGIRNGRRVRGSTFIVPLNGSGYDSDGTIAAATLVTLNAAVSAFDTANANNQRIYSKPALAGAGQENTVISADVPDRVSWLRSRRT